MPFGVVRPHKHVFSAPAQANYANTLKLLPAQRAVLNTTAQAGNELAFLFYSLRRTESSSLTSRSKEIWAKLGNILDMHEVEMRITVERVIEI